MKVPAVPDAVKVFKKVDDPLPKVMLEDRMDDSHGQKSLRDIACVVERGVL